NEEEKVKWEPDVP
uniref:Electrin-2.1 n=1 Tax=Litoria rubella TaxID=104895 RepID=EI21_LITRU|nr:RecName: Full=Electrin-2.1 [Litoria rubella]